MKHGIVINAGTPRQIADLAREAEDAGWDGAFTYDAIAIGTADLYDPSTLLAAMAMTTARAAAGAATRPFADAGATWWIDAEWNEPTVDSVRRRVLAGPPRAT